MRRSLTTLSVLAVCAITLITTASASYAAVWAPNPGSPVPSSLTLASHHSGLVAWQIAFIVVAATAAFFTTATFVARRMRTRNRRPAIS
jgi:uncharacterized membrane protein YhaH (DUF805 family)